MASDGLTLKIYSVSFFGPRVVNTPRQIEQKLDKLIRSLLSEQEYVEFLVGRNGEFDQLASSAIRRAKRAFRDDNSAHVLVLPYSVAEYRNNEDSFRDYYDEIEICQNSAEAHYKSAIQIRNRQMIDRSDLIVCCIEHNSGGAYQTIQYARNQKKEIINLADLSTR